MPQKHLKKGAFLIAIEIYMGSSILKSKLAVPTITAKVKNEVTGTIGQSFD